MKINKKKGKLQKINFFSFEFFTERNIEKITEEGDSEGGRVGNVVWIVAKGKTDNAYKI